MPTLKIVSAITVLLIASLFPGISYAKHRVRSGSCDGIHRCICGSTAARRHGFPRMYNGHNLWQAREWAVAFPRTSIHAGAMGVKPHHVYEVVKPLGNGRAVVLDERGTYERNVSGDIFVDPNGNVPERTSPHGHRMASAEQIHRWNTP